MSEILGFLLGDFRESSDTEQVDPTEEQSQDPESGLSIVEVNHVPLEGEPYVRRIINHG